MKRAVEPRNLMPHSGQTFLQGACPFLVYKLEQAVGYEVRCRAQLQRAQAVKRKGLANNTRNLQDNMLSWRMLPRSLGALDCQAPLGVRPKVVHWSILDVLNSFAFLWFLWRMAKALAHEARMPSRWVIEVHVVSQVLVVARYNPQDTV